MKAIFTAALLLLSFSAAGQSTDREKSIEAFAHDLAAVQAKIQFANMRSAQLIGAPGAMRGSLGLLTDDAIAHSAPNNTSAAVAKLAEGSRVRVVGNVGDWSGVILDNEKNDATVGWVTKGALDQTPSGASQAQYASFARDLLDTIIQEAQGLLDKYRNNQYVRVSGFTTEFGLTGVSLSVQFDFK